MPKMGQMTSSIPRQIGQYFPEELIGSGTFADTYRVRDAQNSIFALKLLKTESFNGRAENEIWALKKLNHDAIPKYISDGVHDARASGG